MRKLKFRIYSLGCKVNHYDSAVLRRELEKIGFCDGANPDLVVVNTCTVTKAAIVKDRQLASKLSRQFPKSKIVVMGCWPQTDRDIKQVLSGIGRDRLILWGVGKRKALLEKIREAFGGLGGPFPSYGQPSLISSEDRARYFIKIGDGCNQFCSYCLIPYARGRLRSRSSREIIKEIEMAAAAGYGEIVLSGIHLGRYGEDKPKKEKDLVALLEEILKIKDLGRVRLSSIEINEVTPRLIALMKKEKRICPHLHISLQSGCDKILKAMNRPYDTAFFAARIAKLRQALPDIAITTDIIVGFPGESEADFRETVHFAKKISFSKIHVFSYSAHERTAAFSLPDKVAPADIRERSRALRELSDVLEEKYRAEMLGKHRQDGLEVAVQRVSGRKAAGKTQYSFDWEGTAAGTEKRRPERGMIIRVEAKKAS